MTCCSVKCSHATTPRFQQLKQNNCCIAPFGALAESERHDPASSNGRKDAWAQCLAWEAGNPRWRVRGARDCKNAKPVEVYVHAYIFFSGTGVGSACVGKSCGTYGTDQWPAYNTWLEMIDTEGWRCGNADRETSLLPELHVGVWVDLV